MEEANMLKAQLIQSALGLDFNVLSHYFNIFFQEQPWNEHLMCPKCKSAGDFGPKHAWGLSDAPTICPFCQGDLVLYWSSERVRAYLSAHAYTGKIVTDDDQIVAWAWGYEFDSTTFYVDTVAVLPEYRSNLRQFLGYFDDYIKEVVAVGNYTTIRTRTHKSAKNVRLLLALLGFVEGETSSEDLDRSYWDLSLDRPPCS